MPDYAILGIQGLCYQLRYIPIPQEKITHTHTHSHTFAVWFMMYVFKSLLYPYISLNWSLLLLIPELCILSASSRLICFQKFLLSGLLNAQFLTYIPHIIFLQLSQRQRPKTNPPGKPLFLPPPHTFFHSNLLKEATSFIPSCSTPK